VSRFRVWQFRLSRQLGRLATWTAALLTLGRMPPFVSAAAIVTDGDQILMLHDSIRAEPTLPGGHLAWRETPEQAVVREVREETGYHIAIECLVGIYAGKEWAGEAGVVRIVYAGKVLGGTLAPSPEGWPCWLPISELAGSDTRDAAILRRWLEERGATTDAG
jgi:8-oxo-dGTP diphosphatase